MIDLHTHSSASDGSLSPSKLMEHAKAAGLKAIALTDHDTVSGIDEARNKAHSLGLVFIPGVEIEIEFEPGEFHLLGLGVDDKDDMLLDALSTLSAARLERNRGIVDLLRVEGMKVDLDELELTSGSGQVGRPHIAEALRKNKSVRTIQEAFDRFLGKGRPFYLPKECLPLATALAAIAHARGVAVAAHPYSLFIGKPRLASVMDDWKSAGIRGVEAYHPAAKRGQCVILENMARERGFFVTAGSDFHGPGKPECGIGKTSGGFPIADSYYAEVSPSLPGLPDLS
jgi:predicted metal-dependent phosphoesterase TrpH